MKLALIGYGKMGRMVEKIAKNGGHEIVSIVDPTQFGNKIDFTTVKDADVCIDFTHPSAAIGNIQHVTSFGKDMVVGTTGWEDQIDLAKQWIEKNNTGLLYGSNFSIGVNLFLNVIEKAAKAFAPFEEYDIAGWEAHHKHKVDSPSGTAKMIVQTLEQEAHRPPGSVSMNSIRCGSLPGTHTVMFDSPHDTITLTHTARSREGFAVGAIKAAAWLQGKKGIYTFKEACSL